MSSSTTNPTASTTTGADLSLTSTGPPDLRLLPGVPPPLPHDPAAAPRLAIGRATLECITLEQTVDRVLALRAAPRPTLVVTANSDHIVRLETDDALAAAYADADLAVMDGQPLVWASKLTPTPAPERVSGVDLFTSLCERAGTGVRLFLLGGSERNSASAARVIAERYPAVQVVGRNTAWLTDVGSGAAIEQIRASGADVVAVFLGCPKQEIWVHRHRDSLPAAAYLCLGGTVDILSGALPRAGRIWQRLGLEWLHRLLLEPGRLWRRYLVDDPKFVLIAARSVVRARRRAQTVLGPGTPGPRGAKADTVARWSA